MRSLPAKAIGAVVATANRGATAVEYGVMVALISAVIVATVAVLGDNLSGMIGRMAVQLQLR